MSAVTQQLARERKESRIAFVGAIIAAILPMVGAIVGARVLADQPKDSASKLLFFDEHASELVVSSVLLSLGALAIIVPMVFLYRVTKFRREQLHRAALVCLVFGGLVLAVGQVVTQLVLADKAAAFATTGDQTYQEAKDVFESGELQAMSAAILASQLALGFAFVMISLNAMRAGLLTRFMGILGIIVGALFVLPIAPGPPVVQTFWLVALAMLFAGRWPSGVPPAWASGKAEPWPSRQEMMEEAQRESERRRGGPASEPEPATATTAPAPGRGASASRRRKRKKRR